MTPDAVQTSKSTLRAVACVAVVGWLARLVPLVVLGPLHSPVDYDEGVHFAAAALVARGHALYGDFAFMHPPGITYLVAPFTWLGSPSTAFGLTRIAMTVVGGVNIYLVGRIASRWVAPAAAVAAAAIYAFYPEIAGLERGVFLEPVLNCLCLAAALVWLGGERDEADRRSDRRAWATGLLLGCAIAVKLWGVFALVACLAVMSRGRWRRDWWRIVVGAAASASVLVLPAALRAPGKFFDDVIVFQFRRAPDGVLAIRERLRFILGNPLGASSFVHSRALIGTAVVVVAVLALLLGRRSRMLRFAAVWYLALVASFVVAAAYWEPYNAALAPAVALLGAGAIDFLLTGVRRGEEGRRRLAYAAGLAVLALVFVNSVVTVVSDGRRRADDLVAIGTGVRQHAGDCVFSFEPQWLLAGDRLPDPDRTGEMAVDTYGAELEAVVDSGEDHTDAASAFRDPASQALVRRGIGHCAVVLLGLRGRIQLGDLLPEFTRRYHEVTGTVPDGPDLWVRVGS